MVSLVARTHGGPIVRAAVFLVLVLSTAGGLIVALPVIGYYATAQYQFANFTYELNGEFDTAAIARLKGVEPDNALASFLLVHPGSARAGSAPTTPGPAGTRATILFADPGSDLSASWFTDATVTAQATVDGAGVDLSATLANRLGVGAGDTVSIPLTTGWVSGRVRRILALSFNADAAFAVTPRTARVDALLPEAAGRSGLVTLRTRAPLAVVRARAMGPAQAAAGAKAATDPLIRTREQALLIAQASGSAHGSGIRTLEALGLLLFIGLAIREGHNLITRRGDALAIAVGLGASRGAVLRALLGMEVAAALFVGCSVWWAIRSISFGYFIDNAWPPQLDGLLASGLTLTLAAYLLVVLVVGLRSFSYPQLLATIREGRSL